LNYQATIYKAAFDKLKSLSFPNAAELAKFMVVQSQHETANYTSKVFKTNNNAFGYKRVNGSAYQLGAGRLSPEGDNYARYSSLSDSAKEVASWIGRRKKDFVSVKTADQYVHTLKLQGYFGDKETNYLAGVKKYLASFTVPQVVTVGLVPVAIALYLIYQYFSK